MVSVLSKVVGVLLEALERLRAWAGFDTLPSLGLKLGVLEPRGFERLVDVIIIPVESVSTAAAASEPERFCR